MADPLCPALEKANAFIVKSKQAGYKTRHVVRKLFTFDHPYVFEGNLEVAFDIFNKVSMQFNVPLSHVKAVGSAQIGYSFFHKTPFTPKRSDLDLAIVDEHLFQKYCEISYNATNGYNDLTKFPRISGVDVTKSFFQSIARGFFRPDYMPLCFERDTWERFFNGMTQKHSNLFKDVNCGIYFSDVFFDSKQTLAVEKHMEAIS